MEFRKIKLFVLSLHVISAYSQCLENVEIESSTSTTASLTWNYICDTDTIDKYKIDYKHRNFLACQDKRKDRNKPRGFGVVEVSTFPAYIENLHPFSEYSFEVRVILKSKNGKPETHKVVGRTDYSVPAARAQPSSIDYTYKNTADKLVFNWSPPLSSSQCTLFNSELGYFVYRVKGTNKWNRDYDKERNVSMTTTLVELAGLHPFSDYMFLLYVSNAAGEYDEDEYLKLEGKTLPTVPDPPAQLKASRSDPGTIHLLWTPAYPHKGEISHYEVRWKLASDVDWKDVLPHLDPTNSFCRDNEVSPETVCYTLTDLDPANYTLEIRTFNKDVPGPSAWSHPLHVTNRTHITHGFFDLTNILIVSLLVLLIAVVVVFILLKFLKSKKKKKARQGFAAIAQDDFTRPIIRQAGHSQFSDSNSYVLRPSSLPSQTSRSGTSRSGKDPLPQIPDTENIYSDLRPKIADEDEDNYLKPNPVSPGRVESCESLDEQGYLRPNFNRFQRLDTSGSDRENSPPLIPPVSYLTGGRGTPLPSSLRSAT